MKNFIVIWTILTILCPNFSQKQAKSDEIPVMKVTDNQVHFDNIVPPKTAVSAQNGENCQDKCTCDGHNSCTKLLKHNHPIKNFVQHRHLHHVLCKLIRHCRR